MGSVHHPIYDHLDDTLRTDLFGYWMSKRGEHSMPSEAAIDFEDLSDLLPHLGIVQVIGGGRRFRQCCLSAEALDRARENGREPGASSESDPYLDILREVYADACLWRAPVYSESVLRFGGPGLLWAMRLILPLGGVHGEVSALLFSARFVRRMPEAARDGPRLDRVTEVLEAKRVVYDHFSVGRSPTGFAIRTGESSRAREIH